MSVASHAPSLPNVLRTVTLPSTVTRMITSKELLLQTSYFPRHHGLAKIWMYYWMRLKWMKYITQTETASADGQLMQSLYGNPDCYECIQPHGNWTWYEQTAQSFTMRHEGCPWNCSSLVPAKKEDQHHWHAEQSQYKQFSVRRRQTHPLDSNSNFKYIFKPLQNGRYVQ